MLSRLSQNEFDAMVVFAALLKAFQPDELFLSLDQLSVRGFAPTEMYGRRWIDELVAKKFVESELIGETSAKDIASKARVIRRPFEADKNQDNFSANLCNKICCLINSDFQYALYLKELMLEVSACECIEYAKYYAGRCDLIIVKESHNNPQLKTLLLECQQGQVFMLIWRAIKNIINDGGSVTGKVAFFDIIDIAMRCYTKYKRNGAVIEYYERPRIMKLSLLKELLEHLALEKESYLQKIT